MKNKYQTIVINKENLGMFKAADYRRELRKSAVLRLYNCLDDDGTFKNPIHVNKTKDVYRIVDGNHRIEAIKQYLDSNKENEVKLMVVVHEGLSSEKERLLYDELAKTVNQTLSDYIKIHFDEVPFFQWVDNGLSTQSFPVPVSIYSNRSAISYANLLSLWEAREKTLYNGKLGKEQSLSYAKSLTKNDYEELKRFLICYKNIFGLPASQNPYYSIHVIWILESIYFRNRVLVGSEKILSLFKIKLFNNILLLNCAKANRSAFTNDVRRLVLEKINTGLRGNKLI